MHLSGRQVSLIIAAALLAGAVLIYIFFQPLIMQCLIGSNSQVVTPKDSTNSEKDQNAYPVPYTRKDGEGLLFGNRYVNKHYGIAIEFPAGWKVKETPPGSNDLLTVQNGDGTITGALAAGVFADLKSNSRNDYKTAMWRVVKDIETTYINTSQGLGYVELKDVGQVAGTDATQMTFITYQAEPDGSINPYVDLDMMFGSSSGYFNLSLESLQKVVADNPKQLQSAMTDILPTIDISEPTSGQ